MLQDLLKGYYRITVISFMILFVSTVSLLLFQLKDRNTRQKSVIHKQFKENTAELSQVVNRVSVNLTQSAVLLTEQLSTLEEIPEHPWRAYVQKHPFRNFFHLDSFPTSLQPQRRVNLAWWGEEEEEAKALKRNDHLNLLLSLAPALRTSYESDSHIVWSYFLGRNLLMIYPWEHSDDLGMNPNSYYEGYLEHLRLFASRKQEVVWTEPYNDKAGKGWVVSALFPVFVKSAYYGAFMLDVSLEGLRTSVTDLPEQPGTIYLVGLGNTTNNSVLLSSQKTLPEKVRTIRDAFFQDIKNYEPENFVRYNEHFFYYERVPNTPWALVYMVSTWDFYFAAFTDVGVYLISLLVLMILVQAVTFVFTQRRFIRPARLLLLQIQKESRLSDKPLHTDQLLRGIPKAWRVWMHAIRGIFEENRSMLQQLRSANLELEKKVHERTKEMEHRQEKILRQNEQLRQQREEIEAQRDQIEEQRRGIIEKNEVMRRYNDALLTLVKGKYVQHGFWERAMHEITERAAEELQVSRVGIWQYDIEKQRIRCMNLYSRSERQHTEGPILYASDYAKYFEEINVEHIIVSNEVLQEPFLEELNRGYLQPYNIISRLDVPFFVEGRLGGVFTCEQQETKRTWTSEDVSFAKSLADIITIAYKAMQRKIVDKDLKRKQEKVEQQAAQLQAQNTQLNEKNRALEDALDQLKQTQSQLVHSEKMASLGVLTAGIAHEINNPINYIKSGALGIQKAMTHIMRVVKLYQNVTPDNYREAIAEAEALRQKSRFDQLVTQAEKVAVNIEMGVERAATLVRELRTFSRMDTDTVERFDVHEGIESTLLLLTNQHKYSIKIVKNFGKLPHVEGYPGKLNQVFMNLLTNAMQAIKGEGTITITTTADPAQKCIFISVKDTGIGMSEAVKSKIFLPFFTTKEVGEGTGLGLAISTSIIEDHRGKISVKSQENEGTEFIIQLPHNLRELL